MDACRKMSRGQSDIRYPTGAKCLPFMVSTRLYGSLFCAFARFNRLYCSRSMIDKWLYAVVSLFVSVCDEVYCGAQGRCRELKDVPSCS